MECYKGRKNVMVHQAKRWLATLMALVMCLTLLPVSTLAATLSDGSTVTELGNGSYAITLKNDCSESVQYAITAGEVTETVTLAGYEDLTLKGDVGESYSVTWQGGANLSAPAQAVKSGTFGQADTSLYDGFDGADGNPYTALEVSNDQLKSSHYGYTYDVNFYYVTDKLKTYYSYPNNKYITTKYTYENETDDSESYSARERGGARNELLSANGLTSSDEWEKWIDYDNNDKTGCLWLITKATPYITFSAYTATEYTLSLVNDCDAPVQYEVTIGGETQTVTLDANETREFEAVQGTEYTITWVGGTDSSYAYVTPTVTEYTGVFGVNKETVYYLDGQEYTGEVSNALTYNGYNMSAGTLYAVETLNIFTRTYRLGWYTYTNINNADQSYSSMSASGARDNIQDAYPGYTIQADGSDLGYAWVFKTVTSETVTTDGDSTVTVTATAVAAGQTGSFKVAALNVDGMPQTVEIANVYDLKLNEDGPGAEGSTSIGQYIETSGIDVLALSENFNFFQQINGAATSYATMTQREQIPTSVGLGDLNNSLFPFDTDGLNLMYKNNLTVSSESMTAWNEHYSPTTNYVVVQVPDQNGADGMIDKGFRFYQVQMAPGVVVDVYILHMDAETSEKDNAVRASQIDQLMEAVEANDNGNPIIIMGDTNCRYTRDPLQSKIISQGFSDPWIELERNDVYPQIGETDLMVGDLGYQEGEVVDKVFYKDGTNVQLEATEYLVDATGYTDDGGLLGDHPPVIVTFEYSFTSSTVAHTHDWSDDWTSDAGYHWHECDAANCNVTMNSLKDGYAAHTFGDFTIEKNPTCSVPGTKTRTCETCGYVDTQTIPTIDHTFDEGVVIEAATPDKEGKIEYTCKVCGYKTISPLPYTEPRDYTFEVKLDKETYNVGDTVTAGIYVKSEDEGANLAGVGFYLDIPQEFTLNQMTSALPGQAVSITGNKFGYNVTGTGAAPIAVDSDGVLLATATFKVGNFTGSDSKDITLTLNNRSISESGEAVNANSTVQGDSATIYNIRVTLNPGNATINGQDAALTLYAKYGQSGLWSDVNRTEQVESVTVAPKGGYRLASPQWSGNMADFAAIAAQNFTESKEYTVNTVKTWTVTFQAGSHVTMATTTATVDDGTQFSAVTKPTPSVASNYTFAGWYNGDTLMADETPINSNLTLTAKATANRFAFTMDTGNFTASTPTGVSNGKATYGTDIIFTVTPDTGYALPIVSYTVDGVNSQPAEVSGNTYTIPGTAITGAIHVYVSVTQYYTITFTNGTGVETLNSVAYVKAGDTVLYPDTSFTGTFTVPSPTAQDGFRLANDTTEPLWSGSNGQNYTTSSLSTTVFFGNTTLTAQAVQQWTVTFETDDRGSLSSTSVIVDNNTPVPSNKVPTVTPDPGYESTGWSNNDGFTIESNITKDTTFTATYEDKDYTLTLPNITGVSYTVTVNGAALTPDGNGTYTVTHGTDVTITVNATNAKVTSVSYTIGSTTTEVTNFTEPFTIDGDSITGSINVNVQATNTYQVTVNVVGGNGTVNGKDSDTVTFDINTSAEDVASRFTFEAAPGYEVVAPTFEDVDGNATYTVTFKDATYEIVVYWATDEDNTEFDDKDPGVDATHDTDVTFTPHLDDEVVYAVWYAVGDVDLTEGDPWTELVADEDGAYTIPGEDITGTITIFYDTVDGDFTFITDYMAAPDGEKMAVLETQKLDNGGYSLGDAYGDMYWSSKYNAYVCFVDNSEDADSLAPQLSPTAVDATAIDYSGDVNGDGVVDPTDSAIISAELHEYEIHYTLSDLWRFRFDVCGEKVEVTAQDIMWILNKFTGASNDNT